MCPNYISLSSMSIVCTSKYMFFLRMMWSAGVLAAISSISYPAISAFVSMHADADKQGLVQVSVFVILLLVREMQNMLFAIGYDHRSTRSL